MQKNSREGKYVNGTRGIIDGFETKTGYPIVKTYDGARIIVEPDEWQLEDGDSIKARLVQIPLRLAWAVTIHKSQGLTFDKVRINLGQGTFVPGQLYTSLSRCRTFEGLGLDRPIQLSDVIIDKRLSSLAGSLSVNFFCSSKIFIS